MDTSEASSSVGSSAAADHSDSPYLSIERLMEQLVERASEIISAQYRVRTLLAANRSIVGELSLPLVLRRVVDAAREIAGARYAALGVIGADGLLEQFVHTGMDAIRPWPRSASCPGAGEFSARSSRIRTRSGCGRSPPIPARPAFPPVIHR